ncbi:RagB/SusD family nutrient uptake outer membrane protein [Parapedobacter tibetensis]|uniref:RagB/SusD family nutrient uptake outer membrane protein n=1 Tax=Parapedobacter tibetensis TaxID=2972951 RepID=UPI00214D2CF2|nr:RagB/SusD family nutrient uptake outer membrane protein [Parapedobacter tibetensis]
MKTIYKTLTALIVAGVFTSCENALDKLPLNAPSDQNFFSNQAELELAINGAYRDLYWMTAGSPYPMVLDNTTDLGYLRTDFSGMQVFSQGAHTPETSGFTETWDRMYSGIGRCNNLLVNMERAKEVVGEDFYRRIQAEASFLRAWYYFWLISLYGDVPYTTVIPETIEAGKIPRTPKQQVVDSLFSDLDFAAGILPEKWGQDDDGRATKGAALALKARIALISQRYEVAAQTAKEVMESGAYELYPDYGALFTYAGKRSVEVIFDMPFLIGVQTSFAPREQGPRNGQGWCRLVPSQFIIDSYECVDGLPIDESPLYDPARPFENRDPRLDASLIRPQSVFAGYVYETHPDSLVTTRYVDGVATRAANQDVTNPFASFTGYLWRKYTSEADIPVNITNSELNFIFMRYAEVLLTYAEAKIELGEIDASVLEAINRVRARAYGVDVSAVSDYPAITSTDPAALREVIRRERKIELADEGFRLLDIRRWKIAEHVMPGTFRGRPRGDWSTIPAAPEINEHGHPVYGTAGDLYRSVDQRIFKPARDYLWPIPQKDMDVNDQLEQNSGY